MRTMTNPLRLSDAEWLQDEPFFNATWGGRAETPERIAQRMSDTVDLGQSLGGVFARPWRKAQAKEEVPTPVPTTAEGWTSLVESFVATDDTPVATPQRGYSPVLATEVSAAAPDVRIEMKADAGVVSGSPQRPANRAALDWSFIQPDPRPVTDQLSPQRLLEVVLGFVSTWRPDSCAIRIRTLTRAQRKVVPFSWPSIGAITWLSGDVFSLPDQVPGATVERYGNGALITVGTPDDPSGRRDDVMAVFHYLKDHGHTGPAPANQAQEPDVPEWMPVH